jgi:hypothetical protein
MIDLTPYRRGLWRAAALICAVAALAAGCGLIDEDLDTEEIEHRSHEAALTSFCSVNVNGYGSLDVEEQYLARVVMCENGLASYEALKAQAVAARGYAKYITDVERRNLEPTVRDQKYDCGDTPSADVVRAVRETSGQVLTHNGNLILPFYVAGGTRMDASCRATSGNTQNFVTYNEHRTGGAVRPSTLGSSSSPANRGAMSQNGADCLSDNGWDYQRILRFFYGDDIRVTTLPGACVDPSSGASDPANTPGTSTDPACSAGGSAPYIHPRSDWNAAAARGVRPRHTPQKFTIHHTVTSNNDSNPASTVRQVQRWHFNEGWSDIGYHFLVDQQGGIWRGTPEERIGAHVEYNNTNNIGIALLGRFDTGTPNDVQLQATGKLLKHLGEKYGIDVNSSTVDGHRDYNATECPGSNLYARLDQIIRYAGAEGVCTNSEATVRSPDIELSELEYRFVRIRSVSPDPAPTNDPVPGFEVDSVFVQPQTATGGAEATAAISASGSANNASAALGLPDNTSCDNAGSTVAGVESGQELILEFPTAITRDDKLTIVQSNTNPTISDCAPGGTAEIAVSEDGSAWTVLTNGASGNATFSVIGPQLEFTTPRSHDVLGREVNMRVDANGIARVEYYAEQYPLGESTDAANGFPVTYTFTGLGNRVLFAVGYDGQGRAVAQTQIAVEITDGFGFRTPRDGGTYGPSVSLEVTADPNEVAAIRYSADGYDIGESTDAQNGFRYPYTFNTMGVRNILAEALDSSGAIVGTAEITVRIAEEGSGVAFLSPKQGGWYTPGMTLRVDANDPAIARVAYVVDGMWEIGESTVRGDRFAFTYEFSEYGNRSVEAIAYDSAGNEIARTAIDIVVTDPDGVVPGGSIDSNITIPGTTPDEVNSASASRLAEEGGKCSDIGNYGNETRCTAGRGGWSTGHCWAFVKGAMIRADVATRADIDRLANGSPCTPYEAQVGARGFKCAADGNPSGLRSIMGLQRVNTPPTQAPAGAIIAWERNCMGAHHRWGHIEIAMGDGYACSDYCAPIRGDADCASVYVPVSN